jgi:RNA polymerase sigma-70 factor (ECF subfamily)
LRTRYKTQFEDAVRNALRALPVRDATLLRLHLEQRMGVDALATMYKVGRSTAGRWLQAARAAVEERVKEELRDNLGLSASEFESIAAQLLSQLEVSVIAVLNEGD